MSQYFQDLTRNDYLIHKIEKKFAFIFIPLKKLSRKPYPIPNLGCIKYKETNQNLLET